MMQTLPDPRPGARGGCLPLAARSADALEDLLLAEPAARAAACREYLAGGDDPLLVVWAYWSAAIDGAAARLDSISDLAAWLAPRLPWLLAGGGDDGPHRGTAPLVAGDVGEVGVVGNVGVVGDVGDVDWCAVAARSLALARLAAALASRCSRTGAQTRLHPPATAQKTAEEGAAEKVATEDGAAKQGATDPTGKLAEDGASSPASLAALAAPGIGLLLAEGAISAPARLPAWLVAVAEMVEPRARAAATGAALELRIASAGHASAGARMASRGLAALAVDAVRQAAELLSGAASPAAAQREVLAAAQAAGDRWRREFVVVELPAARRLRMLARRLAQVEQMARDYHARLEAEKLESLAELAAGAGHEMNNPLTVISGRVQLLLNDETDPDRRRSLAALNHQALRISEMISDMMLFSRPPLPRRETSDVAALVAEVAASLAPLAEQRQIELATCGLEQAWWAEVDPVQLTVALRALGDNAVEAIGRGGRLELEVRAGGAAPAADVEIVVRDTGPGIAPQHRRHLFDPFYSGRQAGRGLGMGLAKCWRIVTNHGGKIDVESEPGRGATFVVRLPLQAAGVHAPEPSP